MGKCLPEQKATKPSGSGGCLAFNKSDSYIITVVHHGGAGTTAAGLRAGRPTLIYPFLGDQPFWGERVYRLGVGPQPIPQKKLTADNLAAALATMVNDQKMQQQAAVLGQKICAEEGIGTAVQFVEKMTQGL